MLSSSRDDIMTCCESVHALELDWCEIWTIVCWCIVVSCCRWRDRIGDWCRFWLTTNPIQLWILLLLLPWFSWGIWTLRETSGLGEPPSNITARSFLTVRSTRVFTGSRGTGLIGLWSSPAAFLSLTNGYAAMGIHSSVSSGSESGMRSTMHSMAWRLEVVHILAW